MPDRGRRPETTPVVSPPAVTSSPPAPMAAQDAGAGNASDMDGAGLGSDVCEGGIDGLRQAVANGDPNEAWDAFGSLPPDDLATLKGDSGLTERFLALIGAANAASALWTLQHPASQWLRLADVHCAASEQALATVLHDVGICDAGDIFAHLADLAGLPSFLSPPLIDPLLAASGAEDQAALISTAEGVSYFTGLHAEYPLNVLLGLAASSQVVLDLFLTSEPARSLLMCDPLLLDTQILDVWCSAADWYRMCGPVVITDLDVLMTASTTGWAPALVAVLSAGDAQDTALLPLPAAPLTTLVLGLIGSQSIDDLVTVCRALHYEPVDAMSFLLDHAWLTVDTARALLQGATLEQQGAVSGNPLIVACLMPQVWIADVLPELVASGAMPLIYGTIDHIRPWLEMDLLLFEQIVKGMVEAWIDAFVTARRLQPLLDWAAADPAGWRALVTDDKFKAILGALQKPCAEAEVAGLWALWTDAGRSVECGYELFHTLYGMRLWSSSQQPTSPGTDWTQASTGITFERRVRYDTVDPNQTTMNSYLARLAFVPRGQVVASGVGFGTRRMVDFKKKSPAPADGNWGDTMAAAVLDTSTTSVFYPGDNFIMMAADSAGAIPAGLTTAPPSTNGDPGGVGGQRTTVDENGNTVNLPAATDTPLNWFENHAQHEIGHGVGDRTYAGVAPKGDDAAKKFAKWQDSSAAAMRTAYFSGVPANVSDVPDSSNNNVTIKGSELGIYLTTIVETGGEPASAAVDGTGGRVVALLPGMSMQDRVTSIYVSAAGNKDLPAYVNAILNNGQNLPYGAYESPGFLPSGTKTHIWSDAEGGFRKYDAAVVREMTPTFGWYSQSSYSEMFAEIYTMYYSTAAHTAPTARNGVDWSKWFAKLEASPDAQLQAGVPPTVAGIGGAPDPNAPAPNPAPAPTGTGTAPSPGGGGIVSTDPTVGFAHDGTPI